MWIVQKFFVPINAVQTLYTYVPYGCNMYVLGSAAKKNCAPPALKYFAPPPHKSPILEMGLFSFIYLYYRTLFLKMSFCHKLIIIIPKSVQPDVVDLWYFKLWILLGLHHKVSKKKGLKNLSLWQKLSSFLKKSFPLSKMIFPSIN